MHKKINSYFLILIILFSIIPIQAIAPIKYYEIDSDIELRGAIFVNVDPDGFYASLNNGIIQIDSNNHYNDVTIKFKGIALNSRLKKYNGFNVGYTHISNNGIITNELKSLKIDFQGFAYLNTDFSTVIINGMTGITTTTLNGLSGNQSISVPNGSSYDLNITNNQLGVWTINGTDFTNRILWTLNNSSVALTNYQVKKVQDYDSDMQPDMDDRLYTPYENDTLIPYWDEDVINSTNVTNWLKIPSISTTTGAKGWMYYGNAGVSNMSSISDTFIFGDDFTDGIWTDKWILKYGSTNPVESGGVLTMTDNNVAASISTFQINTILEGKININAASDASFNYASKLGYVGTLYQTYDASGDGAQLLYVSAGNVYAQQNDDGAGSTVSNLGVYSSGWDDLKITWRTGAVDYVNSVDSVTLTTNLPTAANQYIMLGENADFDNIRVREYNSPEPTWAADGAEQTASGTANITASVTGDNNTQFYNTSQSREFTLTPTGSTSNIFINTTSTDYDITVITYWTEDTTQYNQISDYGYVKSYINYTPQFNIDTAIFNDTINLGIHNFSNDDYIGLINVTINDSYIIGIRNNQEINATAYNLIKDVEYLINFTIPYNNIFTLSNQSDTTAYLGISKQFTDSNYNDPENNPIFSRLWNFGDSNNINTSNPAHIYNSLGNFNANYSIIEDATTNSQTITKEFNVTVKVQPPQNITTIPYQTNVSINWDNYTYADKYSVYELEDGFPYVNTNPVIDGVKDAIYDCAHEFLILSPNFINFGDYGTIYPLRTALGAYLLIESIDNDDKSGDDDTIYYFDLDNDGLTINDPAWKITDNIVKKYLWNGVDSWDITGSTNAVGDSTGGGTHYPIHELFIPVAELGANWTNKSTIKVLVKREDSALSPDVITWYPYGNINNTDTNLWQEMILNDPNTYNLLSNVTLSNYTAINLTPFTIYHGAVSSWNGTTESNYTLFDVITEDIPFYNVSGYILDDLGNKLSGAIVYSCNGFVHEITQSDIYGYWIGYNFREGNYTICGNKSGYIDNSTDIYVSSNMSNVNVTLTAYTITDWEIYQQLLLLESQNDEILLNMSINNTIINDKIDTILIFILLNMAVIVGIIIGKRGKNNDK